MRPVPFPFFADCRQRQWHGCKFYETNDGTQADPSILFCANEKGLENVTSLFFPTIRSAQYGSDDEVALPLSLLFSAGRRNGCYFLPSPLSLDDDGKRRRRGLYFLLAELVWRRDGAFSFFSFSSLPAKRSKRKPPR